MKLSKIWRATVPRWRRIKGIRVKLRPIRIAPKLHRLCQLSGFALFREGNARRALLESDDYSFTVWFNADVRNTGQAQDFPIEPKIVSILNTYAPLPIRSPVPIPPSGSE